MKERGLATQTYIANKEVVEWLLVVEGMTLKKACETFAKETDFDISYKNFTRLTKRFFPEYVEGGRISKDLMIADRERIACKGSPLSGRSNKKIKSNEDRLEDNKKLTDNSSKVIESEELNSRSKDNNNNGEINREAQQILDAASDFFDKQERFRNRPKKRD